MQPCLCNFWILFFFIAFSSFSYLLCQYSIFFIFPFHLFRCVLASLYEVVSVRRMVRWMVTRFFLTLKMSHSLYENHWGSPTLTLLNVLGVLGVLNVLNVLNVLYVLNVLHILNVLHVLHGRIVGLLGLVLGISGDGAKPRLWKNLVLVLFHTRVHSLSRYCLSFSLSHLLSPLICFVYFNTILI